MQGSSFQPCPLCNKSIASALLAFHVNSCIAALAEHASASPVSDQHGLVQEPTALGDEQTSKAAERLFDSSLHPEGRQCITGVEADHTSQQSTPVDVTASASVAHQLTDSGQVTHKPLSAPQREHEGISGLSGARPSIAEASAAALQHVPPAETTSAAARPEVSDSKAPAQHTKHEANREEHAAQAGQAMQRAGLQKAAAVGQEDTGTDQIKHRANKRVLQVADTSEQGQQTQTPPAHKTAATSGNAFAHMMQKQKERAQTWTFYLGRADDGGLFWHFWRDVKGSRPLPDIIAHCSGVCHACQHHDAS